MAESDLNTASPGYALYLNYTASPRARSDFFYIQHVGHHYFSGASLQCERSNYKSAVLLYTIGGKGRLSYREKNYEITRGQAVLIHCMEHHVLQSDPELGWHYKWLHFYGPNVESYIEMILERHGPVIRIRNEIALTRKIDDLIRMVRERDLNIEIKASNDITDMLTTIFLNEDASVLPDEGEIGDKRVRDVLKDIYENYSARTSCSMMAKRAICSKSQLYRIFKAETGYHPYEFLIRVRIDNSKVLLRNTTLPIESIAMKVGFENTSNFIGAFRKLEGITPAAFRRIASW